VQPGVGNEHLIVLVEMTRTIGIDMKLNWKQYDRLTRARAEYPDKACIYVQTDSSGKPKRVGKASKGLNVRYRGGTGYAIDAAMHNSGNLVFVAAVPIKLCSKVESELIWQGRKVLEYNIHGKRTPPRQRIELQHDGESPDFSSFTCQC